MITDYKLLTINVIQLMWYKINEWNIKKFTEWKKKDSECSKRLTYAASRVFLKFKHTCDL